MRIDTILHIVEDFATTKLVWGDTTQINAIKKYEQFCIVRDNVAKINIYDLEQDEKECPLCDSYLDQKCQDCNKSIDKDSMVFCSNCVI